MGALEQLSSLANPFSGGAIALVLLGYFFISWDRRKDDSPSKGDGQVGIKLVLYALAVFSLGLVFTAVGDVLGWALAGAKTAGGAKDSTPIKAGIAALVAGGAGLAGVLFVFLPRTNAGEFPQAERFAIGIVALITGVMAIGSLHTFLNGLLNAGGSGWPPKAYGLAQLVVSGGLAFLTITRLGGMSGWTAPVKPAAAPMPMMQQGYPPQQGYAPQGQMQQGYPPQQGYPAQGGQMQQGYAQQQQQGGGLPPPGGGYPPQGGGYPPR